MDVKPLWNSRQVAEYLGIAPKTLDQWASQGVGPRFLKIRGQRRYEPDRVVAWAESTASDAA